MKDSLSCIARGAGAVLASFFGFKLCLIPTRTTSALPTVRKHLNANNPPFPALFVPR